MSLFAWYPLIDGSLENKGLDTTPLTLHGTVPFTNGRVRTAPTFSANASNYYTMPPITKVNDFSICCWVKCSSTANGWIFYQGVVGFNNNRLGFIDASGAEGKLKYVYGNITYTIPYTSNTWVHMCMTIDENGYVHMYLNGENISNTSTNAGYEYVEGHDLCIGKAETVQPWQNGQLQDFRYYDHCLSPKEVKEIAKGLCLHLPLKGTNARPNLFKNSATMFGGVGAPPSSTTCTSSPTLVFDENAPCGANGKILRATVNRPDNTVSNMGGYFYSTAATGIPTLTIGQKYCVSIWARCTANNVNFLLEPFMEGHTFVKGSANRTLTSEWKRYYAIFTATNTGSTTCFYINAPIGASGTLEYCCPKLELLSPTPYIPNVDDTQYSDYVLDYEPDCSGNEFDATKYGDLTTSDSNGRYNTAVAFNGTNTYLQGLAPTNSECKEFTIATWVKLNNVSTNQALYICRTVVGQGIALFYVGASGIRLDDGVDNAAFPNSTLEPDKWYHIAVTRDTNTRKLYINGSFVSSGATTGALANMGTMYQVGESNAQTTSAMANFLNGSLSDFRLYTSVLSADDIKELYETSTSIAHNPPSLTEIAYYNYVETQKNSTFDLSKFTIVGNPTITDDGIASGFSGTYNTTTIKTAQSIDTTNANSMDIEYAFTLISPLTGSVGQCFLLNYNNSAINGVPHIQAYHNVFQGSMISQTSLEVGGEYKVVYNLVSSGTSYGKLYKNGTLITSGSLDDFTAWKQNNPIFLYGYYSGENANKYNIDLKQFNVKVDGEEVFSGNKTGLDVVNDIEIPYTLGSTGIKVVDSVYLDRVKDVYDQHYLERYYTVDETAQTVYEYPLFRDSMHAYEFDEGLQASITKNGIHNATTLTEATKTSIQQNNTDTVTLIEN